MTELINFAFELKPGKVVMHEGAAGMLARAQNYCAAREKCESEVAGKLADWGTAEEDIPGILQRLKEDRFVDDRRFAFAYVRDKWKARQWGRVRLRLELEARQLPEDLIADAIRQIPEDEYVAETEWLVRKKLREAGRQITDQARQKTAAFLASKGFEPDIFMEIIEKQSNK